MQAQPNPNGMDFIGDIHGHANVLTRLLQRLGYQPPDHQHHSWFHPDGRTVVFLGDFIDRGPDCPEVLRTVRAMTEEGQALAILGNHEYNSVCFHTLNDNGVPIRPHNEKNMKQHGGTIRQFSHLRDEWFSHIQWFKSLPFFIDFGAIKAVHACWDKNRTPTLEGKTLENREFLLNSRKKHRPEGLATSHTINGPEMRLPEGMTLPDKEGHQRTAVRVRWWDIHSGMEIGDIIFPTPAKCAKRVNEKHLKFIPSHLPSDPLVVFGHYWVHQSQKPGFIKPNLICIDHSVGKGGPLVAFRTNHDTPWVTQPGETPKKQPAPSAGKN